MKKQTAVQWIFEKYYNTKEEFYSHEVMEQAKAMEKEQHNVTWKESRIVKVVDTYHEKETSFDDYYSETFKNK